MLNTQHNPLSLRQTYIGPEIPVTFPRTYLSYSSNTAPAYIPGRLFSENYFREVKRQHESSIRTGLPNGPPVLIENYVIQSKVDIQLLTELKDDIKNHIETRVQLFLTQLVLVYKTQICFKLCTSADMQVGKIATNSHSEGSYAAAHSGTLPTLRLRQSNINNTDISFAQNSSFYHAWNSTTYLPTLVNLIDSKLDRWTRHSLHGVDLRKKTTDILNQVSLGTLCPTQGLNDFLGTLVSILESLESTDREESNLSIIRAYLTTATNYFENNNNGYPLVQKLLLRPIDESLGDVFYLNVQKQMHIRLKSEMQQLKPKTIAIPMLPRSVNLKVLQEEIGGKLAPLQKEKSKTIENYVKLCTLADTVHASAVQYFIFLHNLPPLDRNNTLDSLLRIKTENTILNEGLSRPSLSFYNTALTAIRIQKSTSPRHMPFILFSILISISQKILLTYPEQQQNSLQTQSTDAIQRLKGQIQERIITANISRTTITGTYITHCLEDKVHKASLNFFSELLALPDSLKNNSIDNLLKIKTSKTIPSTLGARGLAFYSEALQTIRQKSEKKDLNPQNMGLILCSLLLKS